MLKDFLNQFLPYGQQRALLPWGVRNTWNAIFPDTRGNQYAKLYRLSYLLSTHQISLAVWQDLLHGKLPPRFAYRHFTIAKADGTRRELAEPGASLKALQYQIIEVYLKRLKPHPSAVGYRRGMSIADHAWAHIGARTVITADLADFFPATNRYRVRQFWKSVPNVIGDTEVQLLTNLTTYRGALPQGAPTSPTLSNLVNYDLDAQLHRLISDSGGRYTRYADDLAFSWQMRHRPPADFESTVRRILQEYGYRLNTDKGWQVWHIEDEPEITGVRLTRHGVDLPQPMLEKMKQLSRSHDPADALSLAGYQGYRQMVQRRKSRN